MRTLKERITDLEFQISLLDKQIKQDLNSDAQGSRIDDQEKSMNRKLSSLILQRDLINIKIESTTQKLKALQLDGTSKDSMNVVSRLEARKLKRERLATQLKTLSASYLNYMDSIGKVPGTEGQDAFDTLLKKK